MSITPIDRYPKTGNDLCRSSIIATFASCKEYHVSFFNRIISERRNKSKETPKKTEPPIVVPEATTAEYARLLHFTQRLNSLLMDDRYLARSDYKQLIDEYADINTFFQN